MMLNLHQEEIFIDSGLNIDYDSLKSHIDLYAVRENKLNTFLAEETYNFEFSSFTARLLFKTNNKVY